MNFRQKKRRWHGRAYKGLQEEYLKCCVQSFLQRKENGGSRTTTKTRGGGAISENARSGETCLIISLPC